DVLRRVVYDEMTRELRREESRGLGSARDEIEHCFTFLDAAARWEPLTENGLLARVVDVAIEQKLSGRPVERPTRQRACNLLNIFLRVAAVHAQRVQLHQLARIVLVETA